MRQRIIEMLIQGGITLTAVMVGGFATYISTVKLEEERGIIDKKIEVYGRSISVIWNASGIGSTKALADLFENKGQVVIYGSAEVVKKWSELNTISANPKKTVGASGLNDQDVGIVCVLYEMRKDLYDFTDDVDVCDVFGVISGVSRDICEKNLKNQCEEN